VLADVFGVSGQLMLEALLKGKAEPADIAQLAKGRAQRKIPEISIEHSRCYVRLVVRDDRSQSSITPPLQPRRS
jgi:hypothetical protein